MDTTKEQEQIAGRREGEREAIANGDDVLGETAGKPTVLDVLRYMRGLIEQGYCKGPLAKDAAGMDTYPEDERAVCWCLAGSCIEAHAILRASLEVTSQAWEYVDRQTPHTYRSPIFFSDDPTTTQQEVIDLISRAIAAAESEVD